MNRFTGTNCCLVGLGALTRHTTDPNKLEINQGGIPQTTALVPCQTCMCITIKNNSANKISRIEKLSKAGLRAVFRVQPRAESSPLRRQLKVKSITHLYHEKKLIFVFRSLHNTSSVLFKDFFNVFQSNNEGRLSRVRFPSYCKSLSFLGHPVVRPCISSVPPAVISYRTIYGLSVTCHNLNVQYQKLIFCLQLGNILTTFKLELIDTFIPITYPSY